MDHLENVGKEILDTAHQIKVVLDSAFDRAELNGLQARILGFIKKNDNMNRDVYQKDIEAEFKIRRSSVTSVLNTMEKNGYVIRQSVISDARLKKLVLTDKAKQVGRAHHRSIVNFEKNLIDNMSHEEIRTLKSLLGKVLDNLENMRGEEN